MRPTAAARSASAPRHATVAYAPPKRDGGYTAPRLASERDVLDQAAESHAPRSFLTIREVWNGLKSDLCPAHAVDGMTVAQVRGRIAKAGSRLVGGKLIRPSESTISRHLTLLGEAGLLEFHFRGRVRAIVTHVTFPQVYEDNGGLAAHDEARERRLAQEREASQRYRDRKKQALQASSATPRFNSPAVPSSFKNDDDVAQIAQDVPNFDTVTSFVSSSSKKDLPPQPLVTPHINSYVVSCPAPLSSSLLPSKNPPLRPHPAAPLAPSSSRDLGKRSSEAPLDRLGSSPMQKRPPSSSAADARLEGASKPPPVPGGEDLMGFEEKKCDTPPQTASSMGSRLEGAHVAPFMGLEVRRMDGEEREEDSPGPRPRSGTPPPPQSKTGWLGSGQREAPGSLGALIAAGERAMRVKYRAPEEDRGPASLDDPDQSGETAGPMDENPPPKGDPAAGYLHPYHLSRALQEVVHAPCWKGDREALAAEKLGVAWKSFIRPLTYGQGMRYWDAQPQGERHKRLRLMNQAYRDAWAKSPGAPKTGFITADIPPMPPAPAPNEDEDEKGNIIFSGAAKVRLTPGPEARPEGEMPWKSGADMWTFLEDLVAQTTRRGEAHDVVGAWAFARMEAHRPWEAWVELLEKGDASGEVYEVFNELDLEVRRARKRTVEVVNTLPDGPAAWAEKIREDLQLSGNTIINTARLATTPLRPADYEEALDATRQGIEGGRVDQARAAHYLTACLLRKGQARM